MNSWMRTFAKFFCVYFTCFEFFMGLSPAFAGGGDQGWQIEQQRIQRHLARQETLLEACTLTSPERGAAENPGVLSKRNQSVPEAKQPLTSSTEDQDDVSEKEPLWKALLCCLCKGEQADKENQAKPKTNLLKRFEKDVMQVFAVVCLCSWLTLTVSSLVYGTYGEDAKVALLLAELASLAGVLAERFRSRRVTLTEKERDEKEKEKHEKDQELALARARERGALQERTIALAREKAALEETLELARKAEAEAKEAQARAEKDAARKAQLKAERGHWQQECGALEEGIAAVEGERKQIEEALAGMVQRDAQVQQLLDAGMPVDEVRRALQGFETHARRATEVLQTARAADPQRQETTAGLTRRRPRGTFNRGATVPSGIGTMGRSAGREVPESLSPANPLGDLVDAVGGLLGEENSSGAEGSE